MSDPIDERLRRLEERLARLEARLGVGEPPDDVIGNLAYRKRLARDVREARRGLASAPPGLPTADGLGSPLPASPLPPEPPAAVASSVVAPAVTIFPPANDVPPVVTDSLGATAPPPLPVLPARPDAAEDPGDSVGWDPPAVFPAGHPAPPLSVLDYDAPPDLPRPAGVPQGGDLERAIGLKWAGWFGAAVLVVGAGLAIKYAYDEGWFGGLPDVAKLLLMSLGGFGLIAAGEAVLRRVNRLSAAGLYGAGVAVLFLVGYAGHAWYGVYAQGTAFGLMALATVVGVLLAGRADLVSVAVLSLLGGHAAPILLAADAKAVAPFLCYLLLLQGLALALCHWRASAKWWTLRSLALAATAGWELAVAWPAGRPVGTVVAFAIVYAIAFQAELILTTLRAARLARAAAAAVPAPEGAIPPESPAAPEGPAAPPRDVFQHGTRPRRSPSSHPSASFDPNAGVLFSLFVTAQFVLVLLVALDDASRSLRGVSVLLTAGACAAAGVALLARRAVLGRLSLGFRAQAAALVVLSVPILLDRENVVFGWLALAVAFAAVGVRVRTVLAQVAAAGTWGLAVAALYAWVAADPGAWSVWLSLFGVELSGPLVVACVAAAAGHVVAVLGERAAEGNAGDRRTAAAARSTAGRTGSPAPADVTVTLASLIHGLAGLLWAAAAVRLLPAVPGTVGLLVYAGLAWAASALPVARSLAYLSAAAVAVAAAKWVGVDVLTDRLSAAAGARPFVNGHMLAGLAVAAAMVGVAWTRRSVLLPGDGGGAVTALFRSALTAAVVGLLTVGLSAEAWAAVTAAAAAGPTAYPPGLAAQLAWTVLWTAAASGVLAADRRLIRPPQPAVARLAAAGLLLTAAKHLLVDQIGASLADGPAAVTVVFNLQVMVAVVAVGGLVAAAALAVDPPTRSRAVGLALLVVLVAGSVEVARFAAQQAAAPPWIVRQAGWSVWWSLFAVGSVVAGFGRRSSSLRVAGLALFGLTLVKVVLVDLAGAGTGWRIVSFLGLGLLLLGTSVLYGRYGPALLRADGDKAR